MIGKSMDDGLRSALNRYDPVNPFLQNYMFDLEDRIMAQIRHGLAAAESPVCVFIFQRGWFKRVAAFVALFVLMAGFLVERVSYGKATAPTSIGSPSLMAFADDDVLQSVAETDLPDGDGDSDDNVE